ncbi:hypothetical protein [Vibrio breoganii]|uniref:hypothetical protein n=1 Tax=Vibrio breoganii TaxID=553239 RepID=UPI000C8374E7|nr:hypothetical protein [Vibrio breoganii]PML10431.1 hypothetical protein BCT84_17365 [Vibrio breoganii]
MSIKAELKNAAMSGWNEGTNGQLPKKQKLIDSYNKEYYFSKMKKHIFGFITLSVLINIHESSLFFVGGLILYFPMFFFLLSSTTYRWRNYKGDTAVAGMKDIWKIANLVPLVALYVTFILDALLVKFFGCPLFGVLTTSAIIIIGKK